MSLTIKREGHLRSFPSFFVEDFSSFLLETGLRYTVQDGVIVAVNAFEDARKYNQEMFEIPVLAGNNVSLKEFSLDDNSWRVTDRTIESFNYMLNYLNEQNHE